MTLLFEKKQGVVNKEEIKQLLDHITNLLNPPNYPLQINQAEAIVQSEQIAYKDEPVTIVNFPVRTYIIATDMYLELNNNGLHYETLIRDTTALKEFIIAKFKANRIAGRIEQMKSFSYKKILQSKSAGNSKGQLIPQIKQIAVNSEIFGKDVSAFADSVLKKHSPVKK